MPLIDPRPVVPGRRSAASARHEALFRRDAVESAFALPIKSSHACWPQDLHETLKVSRVQMSRRAVLISTVEALRDQIPVCQSTVDYGQITVAAAVDAVGNWYNRTYEPAYHLLRHLIATIV